MSKLYIVYIKTEDNDRFPLPYIDDRDLEIRSANNKYIGYAYTTSKRMIENFKNDRKDDRFLIRKHEYEPEELNVFENLYKTLKLSVYNIDCGTSDEQCQVLLTKFEYDFISDSSAIDVDVAECVLSDYKLFNNEFICALDRLFYCNNHVYWADVSEDEYIYADDLYSYMLTVENSISGAIGIVFRNNELGILTTVFGPLFKR